MIRPNWFDVQTVIIISSATIGRKLSIKTHGSELRDQEEAGLRDEPVSYLQVAPL